MGPHQHGGDCKKMLARLSEYLDLELPADACREIDLHVRGCEPCADFVRSLRQTMELCRTYQPQEIPGPLASDARQKLLSAYQEMIAGRKRGPK